MLNREQNQSGWTSGKQKVEFSELTTYYMKEEGETTKNQCVKDLLEPSAVEGK